MESLGAEVTCVSQRQAGARVHAARGQRPEQAAAGAAKQADRRAGGGAAPQSRFRRLRIREALLRGHHQA